MLRFCQTDAIFNKTNIIFKCTTIWLLICSKKTFFDFITQEGPFRVVGHYNNYYYSSRTVILHNVLYVHLQHVFCVTCWHNLPVQYTCTINIKNVYIIYTLPIPIPTLFSAIIWKLDNDTRHILKDRQCFFVVEIT